MHPSDLIGLRVAVGVSGAGKTYGVRSEVYSAVRVGMPVLVIDRMHEWGQVPADIGPVACLARNVREGAELVHKGRRLVVVRERDVVACATLACQWARDYPGPAGVAIPEAHRVAPQGPRLPMAIEDIVTAWRHYQAALWCDTQRLALLNRTITEQARNLKLYAIVGDRDTQVVASLGGKPLAECVRQCAVKLASGEAGWHVNLGLVRVGPYTITRTPQHE